MADITSAANATSSPPADESYRSTLDDDCFQDYSVDGLDLPGNDIGSIREPYFQHCGGHCLSDRNCKAWTWSNSNGGTCWLKGGYGRAVFNVGTASGVKDLCNLPRHSIYLIVENCDMRGNDDYNLPGRTYWDCRSHKSYDFTWSDYNGGTCWVKTTRVPCVYAQNKYTGVLVM